MGISLVTLGSLMAAWVIAQNYTGDLFARAQLDSRTSASERELASGANDSNTSTDAGPSSESDIESSSTSGEKKTVVLLAGGGCESVQKNDFLNEFKRSISGYQKAGVELRVLFGSPYTSSKIKKELGAPSRAFHARSFDDEISYLVESGRWSAGDSLLIQLNTHGTPEFKDQGHGLCYDIPEDTQVTTRGYLSTSDIRDAVIRFRSKHPEVKVALFDQSCYSGAMIEEFAQVRGVCTLSSISAQLPAEFDEYFNHQFQKALSHGWNLTRSFESALKDRYLRVRRNQDTPRLSGIPSKELAAFVDLIEWAGEASIEWEHLLNDANHPNRTRPVGVPEGVEATAHPELLLRVVAALAGVDIENGLQDFAEAWTTAYEVSERLNSLANQRGSDGSAKSLKQLRALRRIAQRIHERMNKIREHAEAISSKWVASERQQELRKASFPQTPEERDWQLYSEAKADLTPLFHELGRLRLRLGDIYRLLRELDPDSLIRDEAGIRQLEAWQSCADFKLHVRLRE